MCTFFQVNTFQAVLTTDGNATYVMFLYRDIQWGSSTTTVGFNFGDGIHGYNLITPEGTLNLDTTSNLSPDIPGAYYFRVDQSTVMEPGTGI